ncbi:CopD family protein, partial [Roseisolibacter sp. H3M3-2]|uniref:CopD family protein n=1 Tax=Roseisolibacter sp. H3M3-2 TaxID=3031323 RepID=UPI0023DB1416
AALRGPTPGATAGALLRAFSPVALACGSAVALTGLAAAWWHLGAVDALWGSAYGRTLLLKLALLGGVAALGAFNWRRGVPAATDPTGARRVRRAAAVELTLAAAALVVTAVLVALPTPVPPLP